MATLTAVDAKQIGAFTAAETALSASDVIPYDAGKTQLLLLRNTTGTQVTATIDGADGTTVAVDGIGPVSVASGLAIAVPANSVKAVRLSTIRHYCNGVVAITGGTGLAATLYNI